nr:hypothetical protein [Tanacetum cinerariifolium]
MQTQTSNTLHNDIMEAGGKDRTLMLARHPPYKFTWSDKEVPVTEGSSVTTTERYMENYKNISQDIRDQLNAEAEAVQIILTWIDNDIYSTVDVCPNACEMWKAIKMLKQGESINVQDLETNLYWEFVKFTSWDGESLESYYLRFYKMMNELVRNQCDVTNHQNKVNEIRAKGLAHTANPLALVAQQQPVYHPQNHPTHFTQNSSTRSQQAAARNRGKAIVNSPLPIYDQEPTMVAEDDAMSKDKDIDKPMDFISLSFKKIYKPTNNNLRTSSNTSRANQDNSPRINRGIGYDNQRIVNVVGARENVEQADWRDDTDDEPDDQDLEAHYIKGMSETETGKGYAAYHKEKMLLCKQEEAGFQLNIEQADWRDDTDDEPDDQDLEEHYIEHPEQSKYVNDTYLIEQDEHNVIIDSLDMSYDREHVDKDDDDDLANERDLLASLIEKLKSEIDDSKNQLDRYHDVKYALKVEIDCTKTKGDLMSYEMEFEKASNEYTRKINDFNQTISEMKKELFAHQETISILSQEKAAQIKFYKTREDKEIDKVIALENKVKVLDNIVYKIGQSVQTMKMLNRNCKMSFAKPEFLKKAQRANPRLYDIGCYNDNLALMLAHESDEVEIDCTKTKGDLMSYEMEFEKASNEYTRKINDFNQTISEMRKELFAHQETISILSQEKAAQIKFYKTREDKEIDKVIALENKVKVLDNIVYKTGQSVQTMKMLNRNCKTSFAKPEFVKKTQRANPHLYDIGCYNDNLALMLAHESDEVYTLQCDYLETLEKCECLEKELSKSKIMSNSFEALQKHAINLELNLQQCQEKIKNDKSFKENQSKEFRKEREQYFEIQDLKAQLQDKGIAISELKKLIEKLKGKSVETKFEKLSVIRQSNAFKSQRSSILRKPTIFSDSLEKKDCSQSKKDFSKSTSVTKNNASNDFSKPVTAQTLPTKKKSCLKNTNVLAPGMYKIHKYHTQARTSKLPQDSKKTNKRVSFSIGVIPTTSVSRPQLKSNPQGDRVLRSNSSGKKLDVEEHRRNVKLPKNKMSVTACNDSLNAKTMNVKSASAMCAKCVMIKKHDLCVPKFVAKPLKKTVASESNKKPRNNVRKLHERFGKIYNWSYIKFTPSGYIWKSKSKQGNVNPNVSMPLGNASRTANVKDTMTSRRSIVSNTPLSSNYFEAHRNCSIHRRLWVLKAHDGK